MPQDDSGDEIIPEGWEKRKSRSTGMVYYLNIYTKGKFSFFYLVIFHQKVTLINYFDDDKPT